MKLLFEKMAVYFALILISFTSSTGEAEFKTLRNKRCGYEIQYPQDWKSFEEAPEYDNEQPPEEANNIIFESKDPHKTEDYDYQLGLICYGNGTFNEYQDIKKYLDRKFFRGQKQRDPTVIKETVVNSNKAEIVLQVRVKDVVFVYVLIYCEQNYRVFEIGGTKKFDKNYPNLQHIVKNSFTLEKLFNKTQLEMIKSFKCPAADFVYKSEKVKKKK